MGDNTTKIYYSYKAEMHSVSSISVSNYCHQSMQAMTVIISYYFQMGKCFLNATLLTNYNNSIANNVKHKTDCQGEYYQMQTTSVIQCC